MLQLTDKTDAPRWKNLFTGEFRFLSDRMLLRLFILCVMLTVIGCQKAPPPKTTVAPKVTESHKSEAPSSKSTSVAATDKNSPPTSKLIKTDGKGHKWIGKVPYDVFDVYFEEPLQVAANTEPVAGSSNIVANNSSTGNSSTGNSSSSGSGMGGSGMGSSGMGSGGNNPPADNTPSDSKTPAASTSGDAGWKGLVSMEIVQNEVKRLRGELTNNLKSVAAYNQNFAEIEKQAAYLAALAIITNFHEDAANWKQNALSVRDLCGKIIEAATARGRENFEKCQIPFEKILLILNGSTPPDLPPVAPAENWSESANRQLIMNRMQQSQTWLRSNIQNEKDFKSKQANILVENGLLSSFTKLITHSDYVFADEQSYQNFIKDMLSANQKVQKSTADGQFDEFKVGIDSIQKACDGCHQKYRFE
jgi:cytochrome c556